MKKFASPLTFSAPENYYKLTHSMQQHITAAHLCLLIRFPKNRRKGCPSHKRGLRKKWHEWKGADL